MSTQREFPDLIKAGLKVGHAVYSYIYGEGVCDEILFGEGFDLEETCRIYVKFHNGVCIGFSRKGFNFSTDKMPSITLTPWNPIAGEPFPFPKFEPIVGDVYAFWSHEDIEIGLGFHVNKLHAITVGQNYPYMPESGYRYKHCGPIEEAMHIFGFDKP
jgi:hypothetical protein